MAVRNISDETAMTALNRCDECDNGLEADWKHCPWCGRLTDPDEFITDERDRLAAHPSPPSAEDEALICDLDRIDRTGGLGYDAHDVIRKAHNRLAAISRQPDRDAVIEAFKDAIECAHAHGFEYTETSHWKQKYRHAVLVLDALVASRTATQPQESKG